MKIPARQISTSITTVTPEILRSIFVPVKTLCKNAMIDDENFSKSTLGTKSSEFINNISDIPSSGKLFDGRYIDFSAVYKDRPSTALSTTSLSIYDIESYEPNRFYNNYAKITNLLYRYEHAVADIDFMVSYSNEGVKAAIGENRYKDILKKDTDPIKYGGYATITDGYEIDIPRGYMYDRYSVTGELHRSKTYIINVDEIVRSNSVFFKFSTVVNAAFGADDYIFATGRIQVLFKRLP